MSQSTSFSGTATATEWLSAYVFTSGSLRDLLVQHVAPFADEVLSHGLAERFFFIRYWERGPHLRLRFERARDEVQAELEGRLPSWNAERLEYVAYEPEIERYGGPEAITIAEDCFALSSDVALQVLRDTDDDGVRGAAMLLHIALAHAFGLRRGEAAELFDAAARGRLPRNHEELWRTFQSAQVLPAAASVLWEILDDGAELNVPWLQEWVTGMRGIAGRLARVPLCKPLPSILGSYAHMTSNRLGVTLLDEPYVAFLTARALSR